MAEMKRYRKKPVTVEAVQWFRNGDHPRDESEVIDDTTVPPTLSAGKVVGRFCNFGDLMGSKFCDECGMAMLLHGRIGFALAKQASDIVVCPGDYVITGTSGEVYPCKPATFAAIYEPETENA